MQPTRIFAAALALGAVWALAGCVTQDDDAGTAARHGSQTGRVAVPDSAIDPPSATIALGTAGDERTLAEASQPGEAHAGLVPLREPRLRGTAVADDGNEGVARVRVSIAQRARCQAGDGSLFIRRRIRYHPPPQIERIRSSPGFRLQTRRTRSLVLPLATGGCGEGTLIGDGKLWGEAINGSGLEAVTPPIRFRYRRR